MGAPPQGMGISKKTLDDALMEERRKTRIWQVISLILAIISVVLGIITVI
jgi:hypothetical protein